MVDILNFVCLFVCIIVLYVRLVIAGGRISELEGKVDSLLIFFKEREGGGEDGK